MIAIVSDSSVEEEEKEENWEGFRGLKFVPRLMSVELFGGAISAVGSALV